MLFDKTWLCRYLVDIFGKLDDLNLTLQGHNITSLEVKHKLNAMMKIGSGIHYRYTSTRFTLILILSKIRFFNLYYILNQTCQSNFSEHFCFISLKRIFKHQFVIFLLCTNSFMILVRAIFGDNFCFFHIKYVCEQVLFFLHYNFLNILNSIQCICFLLCYICI